MKSLPALLAPLAGPGCRKAGPPPQPDPPPPAATVVGPIDYPVQTYYEYNGYLDAVEAVQVRARVRGVLEEFRFTEGQEVKKGDLLYRIDAREYEAAELKARAEIRRAEADAVNARGQLAIAQAEADRLQRLSGAGSAAATELDKAKGALFTAEAQRDAAAASRQAGESALRLAQLDIEHTRVVAPIGGRISRTLVTPGNLVGQNETTLLTTIVRVDELYVYYDAAERDLIETQRSAAGAGTAPVEFGVATEEGYPHRGAVDFQENRVETATGTVRVRGRVPNPFAAPGRPRLLYPGLFARIRVPSGPPRALPVIPEDALMVSQEGRFVYVLGPDNAVVRRSVSVVAQPVWKARGQNPGPAWELAPPAGAAAAGPEPVLSVVAVEKGLTPADRVLVTGLTKVRPGAPVAPVQRELRPPAAAK